MALNLGRLFGRNSDGIVTDNKDPERFSSEADGKFGPATEASHYAGTVVPLDNDGETEIASSNPNEIPVAQAHGTDPGWAAIDAVTSPRDTASGQASGVTAMDDWESPTARIQGEGTREGYLADVLEDIPIPSVTEDATDVVLNARGEADAILPYVEQENIYSNNIGGGLLGVTGDGNRGDTSTLERSVPPEGPLNLNNKNPELNRFDSAGSPEGTVGGDGFASHTQPHADGLVLDALGREPNAAQDVFVTELTSPDRGPLAARYEDFNMQDGAAAADISVGGFGGGVDDRSIAPGGHDASQEGLITETGFPAFKSTSGMDDDADAARLDPQAEPDGIMIWNGEPVSHGFTGSDEQVSQLVANLQQRGLIDTSTGEIVWADEASGNFTGSDEETGALLAWLQENRLIDTSTGEVVWLRQPTVGADGLVDQDLEQPDMTTTARQASNLKYETEVTDYAEDGGNAFALPEVNDEVLVARGPAPSPDYNPKELWEAAHREGDPRVKWDLSEYDAGTSAVTVPTQDGTSKEAAIMDDSAAPDGLITEVAFPGADASKNEVAIETLELTHEGATARTAPGIDVWEHAATADGVAQVETAIPAFTAKIGDEASLAMDDGPSTLLAPTGSIPGTDPEALSLNFEEIKFTAPDIEDAIAGDYDGDGSVDGADY